jgi:hypothetical protein
MKPVWRGAKQTKVADEVWMIAGNYVDCAGKGFKRF